VTCCVREFAFALLLISLVVQFSKGNVGEKAGQPIYHDQGLQRNVTFFHLLKLFNERLNLVCSSLLSANLPDYQYITVDVFNAMLLFSIYY
jgi:hypothetical protein